MKTLKARMLDKMGHEYDWFQVPLWARLLVDILDEERAEALAASPPETMWQPQDPQPSDNMHIPGSPLNSISVDPPETVWDPPTGDMEGRRIPAGYYGYRTIVGRMTLSDIIFERPWGGEEDEA